MSYVMFAPDEKIILSGKGTLEQPIKGKGEIYLTNKRLVLIHKSGLIRKKETPLVDIHIDQISYAKVEGFISKVLIVGVPHGGTVVAYKIKVSNPDAWMAEIMRLRAAQK